MRHGMQTSQAVQWDQLFLSDKITQTEETGASKPVTLKERVQEKGAQRMGEPPPPTSFSHFYYSRNGENKQRWKEGTRQFFTGESNRRATGIHSNRKYHEKQKQSIVFVANSQRRGSGAEGRRHVSVCLCLWMYLWLYIFASAYIKLRTACE